MAENKLLLFFILFFVGILGGERHGHHDFFLLQLAIFFAGTGLSSSAATGLDEQYATTSDSVCWNPMIFLLQPNFSRSCGGEVRFDFSFAFVCFAGTRS